MPSLTLYDRAAKERREDEILAPYAMRSAASAGRHHPEPQDALRTCWERDRDRVIHCTAFRRLMYKTQVFLNREGDHNRTRLSHSLEVCQVARSVGSALRLNEALCEALALAHDIGHPPFGHRGEWALNECMRAHGGFRHNAQVLRVVDLLERRSPDYSGLNEVRASLLKHESEEDWPEDLLPRPRRPCLEAQVVDLADSTAYDAHDLEDGLRAGMFSREDVESRCALWRRAAAGIEERHPGFTDSTSDEHLRFRRVANEVVGIALNELIEATAERIAAAAPRSPDDVRARGELLVGHGPEIGPEVAELQRFLYSHFYRHDHLNELTRYAARVIQALFEAYVRAPEEMAPWYVAWADRVGAERSVCDYIAGMTDRFAEAEFVRLAG
jgi:dGTPase